MLVLSRDAESRDIFTVEMFQWIEHSSYLLCLECLSSQWWLCSCTVGWSLLPANWGARQAGVGSLYQGITVGYSYKCSRQSVSFKIQSSKQATITVSTQNRIRRLSASEWIYDTCYYTDVCRLMALPGLPDFLVPVTCDDVGRASWAGGGIDCLYLQPLAHPRCTAHCCMIILLPHSTGIRCSLTPLRIRART